MNYEEMDKGYFPEIPAPSRAIQGLQTLHGLLPSHMETIEDEKNIWQEKMVA